MTRRRMLQSEVRGYMGVVVHNPKHEVNVGTLWRTAFAYNASFIGTIGRRYEHQASDTPKTPRRVPLFEWTDVEDLKKHLPYGCPLIGVELDDRAVPLNNFWHPPNAVYLLGAEDHGLSAKVRDMCHQIVQVPTAKEWSINVAVAGSIVLSHRHMQRMGQYADAGQ